MKMIVFTSLFLGMMAASAEDPGGIANPGFENGGEMRMFETGNVRVVDGVARTHEASSVEKVSPAHGSRLDCNTPLFTWKESRGARAHSVVVSPSPDFSRGARTYPTDGLASFRLVDRLAPGTWYWKVVSPGCDDAAPWKFEQVARLSDDRLPPEVVTVAARVHSADEKFEVTVRDDLFVGVKVVFEGQTATAGDSVGQRFRRYAFAPPPQGWRNGLTVGEMLTEDRSGNSARRRFYLLNAPRPDNFVKLDRDGRYTVGGKGFFPLSICEVQPKHMKEVREAGFDNVHLYRWEGAADDASCRRYLDDCWAADGLRTFVGFDRGLDGDGLMQGNYDMVARRVGALADHRGLFCWYLYGEPELPGQFMSPARLRSFRELINALDPYHPVVLSTWNNAMVGIRDYRPAWDVHWTQAYGNPDGMLKIIESQRERLVEPSPMTLVLGCNDRDLCGIRRRGGVSEPDAFARDFDLLRACAYLGIVMDFNGLSWWWHGRDRKDSCSAAQSPKGWRDLTRVVAEIRALRPVISSGGRALTGKTMSGDAAVLWWTKAQGGKRWLIAVSASPKPVDATLDVPGFGKVRRSFGRYGVWCHSVLEGGASAALHAPDADGMSRYLSADGSDMNDGKTPATAWRTIAKLNAGLPPGGRALLRSGDVFYGTIEVKGGPDRDRRTVITSFGNGPKPVICGTKNLKDDPAIWQTKGRGSGVWSVDLANPSNYTGVADNDANPAFMLVDGEVKPWRHFCRDDVNLQWDFSGEKGLLYVRSEDNPAHLSRDIRVAVDVHGILIDSHTAVSNIAVHSVGGHGMCAGWYRTPTVDMRISDCDFENIGGAELLSYKGRRVRYGNAVEFGSNCADAIVERCRVRGVYDVAFTMQGTPTSTGWNDIHFRDCLVEDSSQAFEIWCRGAKPGMGFLRCSFTGNRVVNVGGGWGALTRPNRSTATPLLLYRMETDIVDIDISGNTFINAPYGLVYAMDGVDRLPEGYRVTNNIVSE